MARLMRMAPYAASHRLFFAVDSTTTEQAVRAWAAKNQVTCDVAVPPFGFERDAELLPAAGGRHQINSKRPC